MSLTMAGKRALLTAKSRDLDKTARELYPVGAAIEWRKSGYLTETGFVQAYTEDGFIRVQDGVGQFYTSICIADILRAAL